MTFWTSEEDQFLIDNFLVVPSVQIGEYLGRSGKAVNNRAILLRSRGIAVATLAYCSGEVFVPCLYCTKVFERSGRLRSKYCSAQCKNLARRKRDYTICPRCNVNPRALRSNGRLRSWCAACEAQQKKDYNSSSAGRVAQRNYQIRLREAEKLRGIPVRREWTKADLQKLLRLYASGMLLRNIAVELNRTLYAVSNQLPYVFRHGVVRRR